MDEAERLLLRGLEEDLLRPESRRSVAAVSERLAEDFMEIGSSGRSYTRQEVIAALAAEPGTGGSGRL